MSTILDLAKYYIKKIPRPIVNNSSNTSNVSINGKNILREKNGVLYKNGRKLEEGTVDHILAKAELDGSMKDLAESMKIFDNPRFPFV